MSDKTYQTWIFENAEKRDNAKEMVLPIRHPTNRTEWLDDWTVKLEDPVHKQVEMLLKRSSAKRID
jgi:hypothetical protein